MHACAHLLVLSYLLLVQWGKGKGPTGQQYKRLDIDGGYEEPAPTKMDAARLPQAIQLQYYKQATT